MKNHHAIAWAAALSALLAPGHAFAMAQIGGGIGLYSVSGCNVSRHLPTDTPQDTLAMNESTGCNGGMASGALHAEAKTGSVGLEVATMGSGVGAINGSGFVSLSDKWELHLGANAPRGYFQVGLSIGLDGSVAPGSVGFGDEPTFLSYALSLGQFGLIPSYLAPAGRITKTGAYQQLWQSEAQFYNYGPTVPILIDVSLFLGVNQLQSGAVKFNNTASVWLDLPPGATVTTSSGEPVLLKPILAPAPEPGPAWMLMAGLGWLALRRRR